MDVTMRTPSYAITLLLGLGLALSFPQTAVANPKGEAISIEADSVVVTEHRTQINGQRITYKAHTGTQPVWDENGHPTATLFYTYYQRSDIKDNSNRPLLISFNGGPGSASVWMHIAY